MRRVGELKCIGPRRRMKTLRMTGLGRGIGAVVVVQSNDNGKGGLVVIEADFLSVDIVLFHAIKGRYRA